MTGPGAHNPDLREIQPSSLVSPSSGSLPPLPPPAVAPLQSLSAGQRLSLLRLARSTIVAAVCQQPIIAPSSRELDPPLLERRACFVTLEKQCSLRGCIGHLFPREPLYAGVMETAQQAALADPRFARVRPDELEAITIEISVLSDLIPLSYESTAGLLAQLGPHHGVALHLDDRTSTFLPQVWEQIPNKIDFLDRLALKGGWEPSTWRNPLARFSFYDVESFQETTGSH